MKLKELIKKIEQTYPQDLQESWDSSGLLIDGNEVNKVLVCLDITDEIAQYAINNDIDLIISHHPLIFMSYCDSFEYIREIFQDLYANKVAVYSMHTNYDNHSLGMNDLFVKKIDYQKNESDNMLVTFACDKFIYKKITDIINDDVRVYNYNENPTRAAVVLGSGGSFLEEVKEKKCDLFISSEFKHHEILYAKEYNITLIDVAHQAEMIFINDISRFLTQNFNELDIFEYLEKYDIKTFN